MLVNLSRPRVVSIAATIPKKEKQVWRIRAAQHFSGAAIVHSLRAIVAFERRFATLEDAMDEAVVVARLFALRRIEPFQHEDHILRRWRDPALHVIDFEKHKFRACGRFEPATKAKPIKCPTRL